MNELKQTYVYLLSKYTYRGLLNKHIADFHGFTFQPETIQTKHLYKSYAQVSMYIKECL